jgi:hypothetical protein
MNIVVRIISINTLAAKTNVCRRKSPCSGPMDMRSRNTASTTM